MKHLLVISVGPVQEFIAAARRTRDLWFGSYLLSEISKATAKAVEEHGGRLIFPSPETPGDLENESPLNVANLVLAELSDADPHVVASQAEAAAKARWREFADPVPGEYPSVVHTEIWNDQIDDVIEFFAVWVEASDDYSADRRRLRRLMEGRKHCRNFLPAKGRARVPKSSLDGLRESVLHPRKQWTSQDRSRIRVTDGEQLDVVGLVKRVASGHQPYPSVSRVAADPWIRRVGADSLAALRSACEQLGSRVLRPLPVDERRYRKFAMFPFEGTAVFSSRHFELSNEAGITEDSLSPLSRPLDDLVKDFGEPDPYLAVLVADGDRMGQALSKLSSADDHREFSQTLARFAAEAAGIVQEAHGVLVYAGGDDVLAFAPVDHALSCARRLSETLTKLMEPWTQKTATTLTLSVGVAVAHFMEPLEDLLAYGRDAEHHAKSPRDDDAKQAERNGLAVHLHKRGGGPLAVRANWDDGLDTRITQIAEWINARSLSGRIAYDLRQIADLYASWPDALVRDAIQRDTLNVLKSKQPQGDRDETARVKQFVRDRVEDAASLRRLSEELLIARQLAVTPRQASDQRDQQEARA